MGNDIPEMTKDLTLYQKWNRGEIGNFGSFQTAILKAYQLADSNNQERLETAFPEWFKLKFITMLYEDYLVKTIFTAPEIECLRDAYYQGISQYLDDAEDNPYPTTQMSM